MEELSDALGLHRLQSDVLGPCALIALLSFPSRPEALNNGEAVGPLPSGSYRLDVTAAVHLARTELPLKPKSYRSQPSIV